MTEPVDRIRLRERVRVQPALALALALPLALALSLTAAVSAPAGAIVTGAGLYAQSFTGPTAAGVLLPAAPDESSGLNSACLTAGTVAGQTPVPSCNPSDPDSPTGALQLTSVATGLEGGVFYDTSFPTAEGLDISFNSYQYGGDGADGIGFILAAADPSDPAPPSAIGAPGGALGYTATSAGESGSGLTDGYLGVGLDVFGNYSNSDNDGSGCPGDPSWIGYDARIPGQVVVRGPGNGTAGYCPLTSTGATDGLAPVPLHGSARSNAEVPVEVAINPSASPVPMQMNSSVSVPAGSYAVVFTDLNGVSHTLSGALPSTLNHEIQTGTIPAGWINPTTGIPDQLTFGWVGSTGYYDDVHEITQVVANSLNGAPVLFGVTNTDSGGGKLQAGAPATWTVVPSTMATGSSETSPVTVSDTFTNLAALTSATGTGTGTGWTCSVKVLTATCSYPASAAKPIAAGTVLPAIDVLGTVAVGQPAGATTDSTATVSSVDGNPAQASDVAVVTEPAKTTLAATPAVLSLTPLHAYLLTLSATLTSGGGPVANQTISFKVGTTPLCQAATNSVGVASCSLATSSGVSTSLLTAILDVAGANGYQVAFAGSVDYAPSTGSAGLITLGGNSVLGPS